MVFPLISPKCERSVFTMHIIRRRYIVFSPCIYLLNLQDFLAEIQACRKQNLNHALFLYTTYPANFENHIFWTAELQSIILNNGLI